MPVRFVHAADLHLDAAFQGIPKEIPPEYADRIHAATFTALDRLFKLCEQEHPDFLILSGDIYNAEDRSVRAQLAVRDGCERLAQQNIHVFLAHGNHDPLSSRLNTINWPDNVHIFGDELEVHTLMKEGLPQVQIHGISHKSGTESRNLAQFFQRSAEDCLQIGVLHCSLSDAEGERYAPCSISDLRQTGLDYWALGHVHERRIVAEDPMIVYPGNTQGLHPHEENERGCMLVTASMHGNWTFETRFEALAPVVWRHVDITLDDGERTSLDALETMIRETVQQDARKLGRSCGLALMRVYVRGRTDLDSILRAPETVEDLVQRLRENIGVDSRVWLRDLKIDTLPALDRDAMLQREDLTGELMRYAAALQADPEQLRDCARTLFAPLYERKKIAAPDEDELNRILKDAENLCLNLMETR